MPKSAGVWAILASFVREILNIFFLLRASENSVFGAHFWTWFFQSLKNGIWETRNLLLSLPPPCRVQSLYFFPSCLVANLHWLVKVVNRLSTLFLQESDQLKFVFLLEVIFSLGWVWALLTALRGIYGPRWVPGMICTSVTPGADLLLCRLYVLVLLGDMWFHHLSRRMHCRLPVRLHEVKLFVDWPSRTAFVTSWEVARSFAYYLLVIGRS